MQFLLLLFTHTHTQTHTPHKQSNSSWSNVGRKMTETIAIVHVYATQFSTMCFEVFAILPKSCMNNQHNYSALLLNNLNLMMTFSLKIDSNIMWLIYTYRHAIKVSVTVIIETKKNENDICLNSTERSVIQIMIWYAGDNIHSWFVLAQSVQRVRDPWRKQWTIRMTMTKYAHFSYKFQKIIIYSEHCL